MENIKALPGKPVNVTNVAPAAVTYQVRFPGVGHVSFEVLPGRQFTVQATTSDIEIDIVSMADGGIRPAD